MDGQRKSRELAGFGCSAEGKEKSSVNPHNVLSLPLRPAFPSISSKETGPLCNSVLAGNWHSHLQPFYFSSYFLSRRGLCALYQAPLCHVTWHVWEPARGERRRQKEAARRTVSQPLRDLEEMLTTPGAGEEPAVNLIMASAE